MACVRRGHDPFMMRLVKALVDERVVEVAMDPVNAKVGKKKEQGKLSNCVPEPGALIGCIVKLAVTTNFESHQRSGAEGHKGHGLVCLLDFEPDLILDKFRVLQGTFVENEQIGERGEKEIHEETEDPYHHAR